jgi:hypothetical protein
MRTNSVKKVEKQKQKNTHSLRKPVEIRRSGKTGKRRKNLYNNK